MKKFFIATMVAVLAFTGFALTPQNQASASSSTSWKEGSATCSIVTSQNDYSIFATFDCYNDLDFYLNVKFTLQEAIGETWVNKEVKYGGLYEYSRARHVQFDNYLRPGNRVMRVKVDLYSGSAGYTNWISSKVGNQFLR